MAKLAQDHTCMLLLVSLVVAVLTVTPSIAADELAEKYAKAKTECDQGNYETASQLLREILAQKPDSGESWLLLAECYCDWDRLQQASEAATEALRYLQPGSEVWQQALELNNDIIAKMNEPDEDDKVVVTPPATTPEEEQLDKAWKAEDWARVDDLARKVIGGGPDLQLHVAAHYYIGKACMALRKPTEGQKYLASYLDLAPDGEYADAARRLLKEAGTALFDVYVADIEKALDVGDLERARDLIDKAKRIRAGGAHLTYLEALTKVIDGQDADASEMFRQYMRDAEAGPYYDGAENRVIQLDHPWLIVIKNGRVYRYNIDGTMPRPLSTPEQGRVEQALMSPDGSQVVFAAWNEQRNTRNLFVVDACGTAATGIFHSVGPGSEIRDMQWFSHGIHDYLTFIGEDPQQKTYGVWWYQLGGKLPEAQMVRASETQPADADQLHSMWSPDGGRLAWLGGRDRYLWVCELTDMTVATKMEERFPVVDFAWGDQAGMDSPAFLVWTDGHRVYKRDVTGGFITNRLPVKKPYLSLANMNVTHLATSADGTVIGSYDARGKVLRLDPAHVAIGFRPIVHDRVNAFAFSRVGRRLAFRTARIVCTSNLVSGADATEVNGTTGSTDFAWSPTTSELLVWDDTNVRLMVDGRPLASGDTSVAGSFVTPRWSPDATRTGIQKNPTEVSSEGAIWVLTRSLSRARQLHTILEAEAGPFKLVGWTSSTG